MKSFKEELSDIKRLCESESYKNEIDETWERLSENPIVLYGAGAVGVDVANTFAHYGIEILCFCDKYKKGIQKDTGLPIISPQMLLVEYKNALIVISTIYFADEIKNELQELGVPETRVFSEFFLNMHTLSPGAVESILGGYERAYSLFCDEKSKKIIMGRLQCYMTKKPLIPMHMAHLETSPLKSQYFESDVVPLLNDEVFVDGGMYTGDTAEIFFDISNGEYRHYYGFEPDKKNCAEAVKRLSKETNVTVVAKGLWGCECQLKFSGDLMASSRLDENDGSFLVDVTALDVFFSDRPPPTFIKMDIEGAELEALKGSEYLIRNYKPKLAICAYHKPEDIYLLSELIASYRGDYKFYLRHYTNSLNETVLYAI